MESPTRALASFVTKTTFDDLPEEVVHETKRIFLDSVGCALIGKMVKKGEISLEFARYWGGPREATIIGTGDKVSCISAAFANGELINALDYDAMPHVTPFVTPAPLALAERMRASGVTLITALCLAHEIGSRVQSAVGRGKCADIYFRDPIVYGVGGGCLFGAAAGASKILDFDEGKTANAFGMTCQTIPVPYAAKGRLLAPNQPLHKYGMAGWMASGSIAAVLLTNAGYTGDTTVLDGDRGFWRMYSSTRCKWEMMTRNLGEEWLIMRTSYKAYPACQVSHTALDAFSDIVRENSLKPEEIESVLVKGDPYFQDPIRATREIMNSIDASFSVAYHIALVANNVKPGLEWQTLDTMKNPKILEFMDKIKVEIYHEAWIRGRYKPYEIDGSPVYVEVNARAKTFRREARYARGLRTDEELEEKFRANATKVLPTDNVEKAVRMIYELEELDDITKLIRILSP